VYRITNAFFATSLQQMLRWSDPRTGKFKTLTKHGTIQYVPLIEVTSSVPTSSSLSEPSPAPISVSTSVRTAPTTLVDVPDRRCPTASAISSTSCDIVTSAHPSV
jgi:hypothetical protein